MIHLKVIQAKSHIITSTVMQHVTQHDFIVNSWRWRKTTQPSCTQNLIPDLLTLTWAFADVPTRLHAKHTHTSGLLQRNNTYSVISYTLTVKISSSVNHVKSMKPLTLCMYISIYIYIFVYLCYAMIVRSSSQYDMIDSVNIVWDPKSMKPMKTYPKSLIIMGFSCKITPKMNRNDHIGDTPTLYMIMGGRVQDATATLWDSTNPLLQLRSCDRNRWNGASSLIRGDDLKHPVVFSGSRGNP